MCGAFTAALLELTALSTRTKSPAELVTTADWMVLAPLELPIWTHSATATEAQGSLAALEISLVPNDTTQLFKTIHLRSERK